MEAIQRKERIVRKTIGACFLFLALVAGLLVVDQYLNGPEESKVLAGSAAVTVNVNVYGCELVVTTHPERRIPATNNWDTILSVGIYNNLAQLVGTVAVTTNTLGQGTTNLCNQGIFLTSGSYTFRVRGYSHLVRQFANIASFTTYNTTHDFTVGGQVLLAGETSTTFDNFVNSLDLSTQLHTLFTNNNKNDLNQDGLVNSLDLSNTFANYLLPGE